MRVALHAGAWLACILLATGLATGATPSETRTRLARAEPGAETLSLLIPQSELPDSLRLRARAFDAFARAMASEFAGEHDTAVVQYEEALRLAPGDPEILIRLASARLEMSNFEGALAASDSALATDSLSAEAHWIRGASLSALGRHAEAAQALTRSTEITADPRALELLVQTLEQLGRESDMLAPLGALIESAPPAVRLRERRARILTALGRVPEALDDYRVILEESPRFPGVHERVAALLPGAENRQARLEFYRALVDARPVVADFRWKLVKELLENERWSDAEAEIARLREQEPDSPLPVLQLALLANRRGDIDSTFTLLDEAARLGPQMPTVDYWKMRINFNVARYDSALAASNRLLAARPRSADAWQTRALCLVELGRNDEAIEALESWAEHDPENEEPPYMAAGLLRASGRLADSLPLMREAVRRAPDRAELLIDLATFLEESGSAAEAEEVLRTFLAQHPDDAVALNGLGYLLVENGRDLAEAEKLISRALESRPDDPAILDSMGWLWYKKGDLGKAEKWLQRAIGKGGMHPEIFAHLARVHSERRDFDRARQTLEQGLQINPGDEMLDSLRRGLPEKSDQ